MSLTRAILEAHVPGVPDGRPIPAGASLRVRPDVLLADIDRGRVALGRFAARGLAPRGDLVVTADTARGPAWIAASPESSEFEHLALRCGARRVPPGAGDAESIALDLLAAPGRMLAGPVELAGAGALGALAWPIGEIEMAALLAGESIEVERVAAQRVRLYGGLGTRCEGHDVAAELLSRGTGDWRDAVVEIEGEGLRSLSVPERAAIARILRHAGARAVLFASDEQTRDFLRARGRESDWRRLESNTDGPDVLPLDLGWVVPRAVPLGASTGPAALTWWFGVPVSEVHIGSSACYEDLVRFADLLAGFQVSEGMWVEVHAGSTPREALAVRHGVRDRLVESGVHWRRAGDPARPGHRRGSLRLGYGLTGASRDGDRDLWLVGLQACAAAALSGRVEDPRSRIEMASPGPLEAGNGGPAWSLTVRETTPARASGPQADGHVGPLCGPVVARFPHDLDGAHLLTPGPRVRAHYDAPEKLGGDILPGIQRLASGPGARWLVVQGRLHGFESGEAGLLALRSLGVRAILATEVEASARRLCAAAGLLALSAIRPADLAEMDRGDELELVGGLELMAVERSRVVRDLTRARSIIVLPELDVREWNWVRSGGRLAGVRTP